MRVIVNADDLGSTPEVNRSIFELMDRGLVTSSTLLVGAPSFAEAVKEIPRFPRCSFGVHLALTEMPAVTSPSVFRESGLTDDQGRFRGNIRDLRPSASLKEAIFAEWCAQIEMALDAGVHCTHLDSHHHVHTIPWLFGVLRRVVDRHAIRSVRISKNWYSRYDPSPTKVLLLKKAAWNMALRRRCGVKTTDCFTSFTGFSELLRSRGRVSRTVEAMVHPGNADFAGETELLSSGWRVASHDLEVMSYREL